MHITRKIFAFYIFNLLPAFCRQKSDGPLLIPIPHTSYLIPLKMQITTVIFDMDGLLIDSEPLWQEAGKEILALYNATLTEEQYHASTGLRTKEWIHWWFSHFRIDLAHCENAEKQIVDAALYKIGKNGIAMPGVDYVFNFFRKKNFKIGLASSSPISLIEVVAEKLEIKPFLHAMSSAESLQFGKPHPQVFLDCAEQLNVSPLSCVVFEDSFNGVIAAKAARMKCVAVPAADFRNDARWSIADLKIDSLSEFDEVEFSKL